MIQRTVFIGDSVTDCHRLEVPPLGDGYVRDVALSGQLEGEIINMGTSGHRLIDLVARWEADVIDQLPTRVSIAIGINDTWRRYDDNDATAIENFEENYRSILARTTALGDISLVLCEPFLLPVLPEMHEWREDLDPKIAVVRRLAQEFGATLVPFDAYFTERSATTPMHELAEDGIHPSGLGHQIMAKLWLSAVNPSI